MTSVPANQHQQMRTIDGRPRTKYTPASVSVSGGKPYAPPQFIRSLNQYEPALAQNGNLYDKSQYDSLREPRLGNHLQGLSLQRTPNRSLAVQPPGVQRNVSNLGSDQMLGLPLYNSRPYATAQPAYAPSGFNDAFSGIVDPRLRSRYPY